MRLRRGGYIARLDRKPTFSMGIEELDASKGIDRTDVDRFVRERGMPGFSPTQGHVPAAVPFMGHAIRDMKAGRIKNTMFVAKGSLFLGRMSQLSDGLSFLLETNPKTRKAS